MSYLSKIFWTYFLDVCRVVPNDLVFLVCLSVCSLPQCLNDIMLTVNISSSGWAIFLKFSGDILGIFIHWFQIISDFLYVYQSDHCLTSLLKLWDPVLDELSFSNFLETFLGLVYNTSNNFIFLVCLSVCSLPHFVTDIMLTLDISSSE